MVPTSVCIACLLQSGSTKSTAFPAYAASTTAAPGNCSSCYWINVSTCFRAMTQNSGLFDLPLALTVSGSAVSVVKGSLPGDEDLDDSDYDLDLVDSVDSVDWPVERFLAAPKASVVGWGFKFIWLLVYEIPI
ncbi:conserved hypothetical protein [Ricinus communis]|uniref:Uncharacterized protein n=1 Tax=Ricinus communis TaxID=3988 RepID=B9T8Y1_RICCO|nr:conserved hypothetical protein [Ricinus communis]